MKYHPDKNDGSLKSNQIFRIILDAYQVLSDNERRKEYDVFLSKSTYLKRGRAPGRQGTAVLSGKAEFSSEEILERINIILWEVHGLVEGKPEDPDVRRVILIILTFLDKWILEPYGFPDYFMEARKLGKTDPRMLVHLLGKTSRPYGHTPYSSVADYFYDIRKRADKLIEKLTRSGLPSEIIADEPGFIDRLTEYDKMAIYYLSRVLDDRIPTEGFPMFEFSDMAYNYGY